MGKVVKESVQTATEGEHGLPYEEMEAPPAGILLVRNMPVAVPFGLALYR